MVVVNTELKKINIIVFEIINGKIVNKYFTGYYKQKNGSVIEIGTLKPGFNGICKGNPVWLNNKPAPDGKYSIALLDAIFVIDGIIKRKGIGLSV